MFPNTEPMKWTTSGGRVEIGARGRLFGGSIIPTKVSFDRLVSSLVGAREREDPGCFEIGALACFLFLDSLSRSFVSFGFIFLSGWLEVVEKDVIESFVIEIFQISPKDERLSLKGKNEKAKMYPHKSGIVEDLVV